jgi:hypothetical protein
MSAQTFTFAHRLARSILPSPISALLCICFGAGSMLVYLVLASVSIGTALPKLLDGEWAAAYTNNIVRPLLVAFSNITLSRVLIILLWGLLGFVVYLVVEYSSHLFRNWRSAEHNVQVTDHVIKHPGLAEFLLNAVWRLGVLAIFAGIAAWGLQPLLHQLSVAGEATIEDGITAANNVAQLLLLTAKVILAMHIIVVFLRLFLMRTRLFGNDLPEEQN